MGKKDYMAKQEGHKNQGQADDWNQSDNSLMNQEKFPEIEIGSSDEFDWMQEEEINEGVRNGIDIMQYADPQYSALHMRELRLGLENGLDISAFSSFDYSWQQMREIRLGLEDHLDIEQFNDPTVDALVMKEIRMSMKNHVDISEYVRKGYPGPVLREVRIALEKNVTIDEYLDVGYDGEQLKEIRLAIMDGQRLDPYLTPELYGVQLEQIRLGLELGIHVSEYAKPEYEWHQMQEIRLGLEERLDVSLYQNSLFSWQQMREIRLGLQEGIDAAHYARVVFSAEEMERMRQQLLGRSQLPQDDVVAQLEKEFASITSEEGITQEIQSDKAEDGQKLQQTEPVGSAPVVKTKPKKEKEWCKVIIAENEMAAYIILQRASDGKRYEMKRILEHLAKNKVLKGINRQQISEIMDLEKYDAKIRIAEGVPRGRGIDGSYEFFFDEEFKPEQAVLPDGSVDYTNMRNYQKIGKGDVIAVYHHPKEGEAGVTVTGKVLAASKGKELPMLRGKGFIIDTDGVTYIANADGRIERHGNEINISTVCVVDGDVKPGVGNIDFKGDVFIHGSVRNGMIIRATGDVVIDGNFEAATIICGRNAIIKTGAASTSTGKIVAEGDVNAPFFESVVIEAKGKVTANYFMNCDITAGDMVIASGMKGAIIGGKTRAIKGITAGTIGNKSELGTYLELGISEDMRKMESDLRKKMEPILEEIKILDRQISKLESLAAGNERLIAVNILKLQEAKKNKQNDYNEMESEWKNIQTVFRNAMNARLIVKGIIYRGVLLKIDTCSMRINEETRAAMFKRVTNRIAAFRV